MITIQKILDQLNKIIDPDLHKDIVTLGFVQNVRIDGGDVHFDIMLTTPACPIKEEFRKQAEDLVGEISGVKSVSVNLTSAKRTPQPQENLSQLSNIDSIIAISSCKGGVGKSTVAAHFAQELASRKFKVGLVDCDIHGPSIPSLFNLKNVQLYTNQNKQLLPIEKNGLKLMSFGFILGDAPAVMRGPIVTRYIQQILFNTAWGELDYLFIDMPPGTGDIQLTITQSLALDGAVIVTTPQTLSLIDVARGILMFEKVNVPILGIVENMAYFKCDNCQAKHFIFGSHQKHSLKERFGIPSLGEIPLNTDLTHNMDEMKPNAEIEEAVSKMIRALGKSKIEERNLPQISFNPQEITLTWKDGTSQKVSNRQLRANCQCALCINEMTGEKMLNEKNIRPDIAPTEIRPLGNYALGINWNDGHTSGIYSYELIDRLKTGDGR